MSMTLPGPPRIVLAALAAVCLMAGNALAAPRAEPWPRWEKHDPASTKRLDHGKWDGFLDAYVVSQHPSGINRFGYGDVTASDRQSLDHYLAQMQGVPISGLNRREQLAYWINLYNAATVDIVLAHFPVESIRDINPSSGFLSGLLRRGPWQEALLRVEGEAVSLDDIEHRILRPIWRDNRIHYAVNCASLGCPDLQEEAFTAENTERLLERGARTYINHPRGASFQNGVLRLSSIYDWFQDDFGSSMRGVLAHLMRYAEPPLRTRLQDHKGDISYDYDWSLNTAGP